MEKTSEINCFVPNCNNKKFMNEQGKIQELKFFRVPDGIEGLFWTKSVKIRQRKYDKMIDLLSSTDYMLGLGDSSNKSSPEDWEYCCEVHFDIYTDIERNVRENGLIEYTVKPGVVPSIKPKQKERLCDLDRVSKNAEDDTDMNNEITSEVIKCEESMTGGLVFESNDFEESVNEAPTNGYVSIVDISTLTNQTSNFIAPLQVYYEVSNLYEQQPEISCEPIMPMLPLTVALMKRKSPYYMGLQQSRFLRLLQLASQRSQLSDVMVMITLRKLSLNEEFEALGDLFDIDKTTTEQYFHESKHIVINLVDILATTTPSSIPIEASPEPLIKMEQFAKVEVPDPMLVEPIKLCNDYDAANEVNEVEQDEVEPSSPESSASYIGSENDPDFQSDDFDSDTTGSLSGSDIERTDECTICNQLFAHRRLETHIQSHFNFNNVSSTTCGLCLETFETKLLIRAHQKDTHGGGAYCCDVCGRKFTSKRSVNLHILTKHAELKTFLCDLCGDGFAHHSVLSEHIKRKHVRLRKYECDLCDKKYLNRKTLEAHICAIHTDKRPFKCTVKGCSKTFNRESSYNYHSRAHAEDKFQCTICSKLFSYKTNLRTHLRNIHGRIHV